MSKKKAKNGAGDGESSSQDPGKKVDRMAESSSTGKAQQARPRRVSPGDENDLSPLGEKIFLDRYALKDMDKRSIQQGDLVVVCVDSVTGQREIGIVQSVEGDSVSVELAGGETISRSMEHVDRPLETHPDEMQARTARGIAAVESSENRAEWEEKFRWLLAGWRFVPGGRILSAAGTDQELTFYNCYVVPSPHDSREGIIRTLGQMTEIMSRGGGVGINLSSLRPRYGYVKGVNGRSSGSVSWGSLYSFVTGLIEQGGSRRGALMLILNIWHPDVAEFIDAKREKGRITNANISVGVTDDFMAAVDADGPWDLVFPDTSLAEYDELWDGDLAAWRASGRPMIVHRTVRARDLWNQIIESAWSSAEPGLWFSERSNAMANSHYFAPLVSTNPCGEQPLPAWGVCNLGALNLSRFALDNTVDWQSLGRAVKYATRFLDNVIDVTPYYFEENREQQVSERRVGLGTMGLADLMIRCGVRYGSDAGNAFCDRLFRFIAEQAYLASSQIASEKGSFPRFEAEPFLSSGFMRGMSDEVRDTIRTKGIRNVTLLTQAPTGTTGTMVGTSTGIEPFFSWTYYRQSRLGWHEERVEIVREWKAAHPDDEVLPDYFVTAMELSPFEHVGAQAAIQRWIDSAISKTCNVPSDYTVEQTGELYERMYRLGCKGGTVYRDGSRDEQVLHLEDERENERSEAVAEAVRHMPREISVRPRRTVGETLRVSTPFGKAYVTVNRSPDGQPFEVFVNIGKAGTDLSADAEAIGRLISLMLRVPSPLPPAERLELIVSELAGIGGSRHVGFGADRIRSIPDGIARALASVLRASQSESGQTPTQPSLFEEGSLRDGGDPLPDSGGPEAAVHGVSVVAVSAGVNGASTAAVYEEPSLPGADLCPVCGHATLVHVEGCMKCYACGHSEC